MSEKRAKEKRREEKETQRAEMGNHLFDLTIGVYDSGKFTLEAPKGASIPLALDCCMRACHQLWSMVVKRFSQPQTKKMPNIIPGKMADIDLLKAVENARKQGG